MSWEEMSKTRYKCPCGDGEWEEIMEGDDWNRYRYKRVMLCPKCRELYDYVESTVPRPKGRELNGRWIKKIDIE